MSTLADPAPGPPLEEMPSLDGGHWRGGHLAETRWSLELARLLVDPVFVPLGVARGDGRPVVLMPGFMAGDQTLTVLAAWLWRLGYRPRTCGFVANVDCSERASVRVEKRVRSLHRRSGRRVALIGHSRGGHFARALATRLPDCVSHAISLGGGLQQMLEVSAPTQAMVAIVRRGLHASARARSEHCFTNECHCEFTRSYAGEFPIDQVRLTSIYSKGDGVVRWPACVVPYADCVEVTGSHVGLICNRKSYRAIAAALAAPELPLERIAAAAHPR
jgi:triacylglycerol lipase